MSKSEDHTSAPPNAHSIAVRTAAELEMRLAEPLAPGLYLVSTPIGNLADITLRAIVILARATRVYCEDTRQSLKLLQRYGISQRLDTYHEHNGDVVRPRILAQLEGGASVAILSDAGTPLISDPGYKLVRSAIEADHTVIAIPGASAVMAGLVGAGLPTDSFHFAGFLPQKSGARRARIMALSGIPGTIIVFEAPGRLAESLADLAEILGERTATVARELTKLNETYHRGTLADLANWASTSGIKGEMVILVGPGIAREIGDAAIQEALAPALAAGSLRDAATLVAEQLGVARSRVYKLAVTMLGTSQD